MRFLKYSFLLLFIAACNSPKAVYDYDQKVDFSQYSNYSLFPDLQTGVSQLDESRLLESLQAGLNEKGLIKSEDPGIYVNVYTKSYEQDNRSRLGVGIGGGGGNVGVGVSGGIPVGQMDTYLELTFDFIDVKNDALIWQAVVESPFKVNAKPQARKEQFDRIVSEALKGYPPKQ